MISRHTSPTYTNGDRDPIIDQNTMGIPKNSSPILDPHKTTDVSTKSSPIAVVADGEVVVFDDRDDWKGDLIFLLYLCSSSALGDHAHSHYYRASKFKSRIAHLVMPDDQVLVKPRLAMVLTV